MSTFESINLSTDSKFKLFKLDQQLTNNITLYAHLYFEKHHTNKLGIVKT